MLEKTCKIYFKNNVAVCPSRILVIWLKMAIMKKLILKIGE